MSESSTDRILEVVRSAVSDIMRVDTSQVQSTMRLGEDLGMESMDYVDLQFRLETEFGVEFFQGSAADKLDELFAPSRLAEDGLITKFGEALLRLRLPEVAPDRLRQGQPIAGIEGHYTPRTWVRVVQELEAARPTTCGSCGSGEVRISKPSILTCADCHNDTLCPDGERCLESWAESVRPRVTQPEASAAE